MFGRRNPSPDKGKTKGKLSKTRNRMLLASVLAVVLYTVANFFIQNLTGSSIDSTQTQCWFLFWGTTIFTNAGITVAKTMKGDEISTSDAISGEGDVYEDDSNLK